MKSSNKTKQKNEAGFFSGEWKQCFSIMLMTLLLSLTQNVNAQAPDWIWGKSAGGTSNGESVVTDGSGNVFITGEFRDQDITFGTITLNNTNASYTDVFIVKYDASGNVQWAKSAGGTDSEYSYKIATDITGNVFMVGEFQSAAITFGTTTLTNAGSANIFIVKYDASGNVIWAKSANGSAYEEANSVTTDSYGNVFVAGWFESPTITFDTTTLTNAGSTNMFIVKYDASGNVVWAKHEGGTADDYVFSICADINGNVAITGEFSSPTITFGTTALTNIGGDDIFIAKYDASGNVLWAKSAGGVNSEYGYSITADMGGNVFITGNFNSANITIGATILTNAGDNDIFIAKYDTNGNVLWANSAGSTAAEYCNSAVTDANGNLFITGWYNSLSLTIDTTVLANAGGGDIFIVRYNTNGNVHWAMSAGGISNDAGNSIAADANGGIFITGRYGSPSIIFGADTLTNISGEDVFIAMLGNLTGIANLENINSISIYPNPAKDKLTISNMLWAKGEMVTVTITDITGKSIYKTTNANSEKLVVNTSDFADGIYTVQVRTKDFVETKKVIIAR